MTALVRPARAEDGPCLRALRLEAGWDADAVPAWFEAAQRGERAMWVAERSGQVVAMVALDFVDVDPDVADGRTVAAVSSLVVTASAGRQGLGRSLTRFAEDQAQARGIRVLTLNTRPSNAAALALYRGLGYHPFKQAPRAWGDAVFLRKALEAAP
ncbi:MAG: N-acetyltransferase family protein [Myxococcaceae bacterium]